MARADRTGAGAGEAWRAELAERLSIELDRQGYGTAEDRQALAAALAAAIAEMVDRRLDQVFGERADFTAGRAKELLRRSLQTSFRRELKHIIREVLDETQGGQRT